MIIIIYFYRVNQALTRRIKKLNYKYCNLFIVTKRAKQKNE